MKNHIEMMIDTTYLTHLFMINYYYVLFSTYAITMEKCLKTFCDLDSLDNYNVV